jgi:PAS domain S-box-containing protein
LAVEGSQRTLGIEGWEGTVELARAGRVLLAESGGGEQLGAALERNEMLFRALSENASDIVSIVAGDGTLRYVSPSVKRLLGYEPEELAGCSAGGLVHPGDLDEFKNVFRQAIENPGINFSIELRFRRKDGSWRVFESRGKNLLENPVIAGLVVNSRDITQRKKIEAEKGRLLEKIQQQHEQLRSQSIRLRQLAQQVISAQEEERHRVSRELHDEAGQALTALKVSLEMVVADLPAGEIPSNNTNASRLSALHYRLCQALALCESTMEQVRQLAHDLRPAALDDLGLSLTLEGFCRDFADRTHLSIVYHGEEVPSPASAADICLYRFLQEGLTNAAKHSQASQVRVTLRGENDLVSLAIQDDGKGFDQQAVLSLPGCAKGIGLLGLQERIESLGGRLEIDSQPGQGARLVASLPWAEAGIGLTYGKCW